MQKIKKVEVFQTTDERTFPTEEEALHHQKLVDESEEQSGFLPWGDYCECGCHGFPLCIEGRNFWTTSAEDVRSPTGRKYFLGEGHGFGGSRRIGEYNSWRELDEALLLIPKGIIESSHDKISEIQSILAARENKK